MRKDIVYYGNTYTVRDWVKYVATDEDGMICGFDEVPYSVDRDPDVGGYWAASTLAAINIIGHFDGAVPEYKATLRGV